MYNNRYKKAIMSIQKNIANNIPKEYYSDTTPMIITGNKKRSIPKRIKVDSWYTYIGKDKGSYSCLCCHKSQITQLDFQAGHIIPASSGGNESISNIVPICLLCNLSMSNTNMIEFQKRLGYSPTIDIIINNSNKNLKEENYLITKRIFPNLELITDLNYRQKKYTTQCTISLLNINNLNLVSELKKIFIEIGEKKLVFEIQKLEDVLSSNTNNQTIFVKIVERIKIIQKILIDTKIFQPVIQKQIETIFKNFKIKRDLLLNNQIREPVLSSTQITDNLKCHFCIFSVKNKTYSDYGHHLLTKHLDKLNVITEHKDYNSYSCLFCSKSFFSFVEHNLGCHFYETHKNLMPV